MSVVEEKDVAVKTPRQDPCQDAANHSGDDNLLDVSHSADSPGAKEEESIHVVDETTNITKEKSTRSSISSLPEPSESVLPPPKSAVRSCFGTLECHVI